MSALKRQADALERAAVAMTGQMTPRAAQPGQKIPRRWRIEVFERGHPELGRFHVADSGHLHAFVKERPGQKTAYWEVVARGAPQKFGQTQVLRTVAAHAAPNVAAAKREVSRVFGGDYPAEWRRYAD